MEKGEERVFFVRRKETARFLRQYITPRFPYPRLSDQCARELSANALAAELVKWKR